MNKTRQLLISLLTLLCCSTGAWALDQDGEGYYLLGSVQDWQDFAALVEVTPEANAKMTADIDLGTQITMIADDSDNPYQGIFDGQGHTLTVNWTTDGEDRVAPFRYADGATIKRLHVDGSISKTDALGRCPAGILACSMGSATTSIIECWSSVSLYAYDTMGGLLAVACGNSITNIIDCVFSGMITASNGYSGGFASHADREYLSITQGEPTVNITRGLNLGTFSGSDWAAYTFIRMDNPVFGTHTVNSCYYKNVYGNAQGTQATDEQLADGTITTALNAGRTGDEAVWVQDPVTNLPMLSVFIAPTINPTEYEFCCDQYEWHGQTYTESGIYTYEDKNESGKVTDIYTLELTVYYSTSTSLSMDFYVGDRYNADLFDFTVEKDGKTTYYATTTNVFGCDSIITLNVNILEPQTFVTNDTINAGESYEWRDNTYTVEGTYTDEVYTEYGGVMEIYVLNLIVIEPSPGPELDTDGMFWYLYDHDAETATVTYLRDSDKNRKGGTYVGDVVIPAKAPNGYDVTVIGEDAFYNCPEMTSLTIPATIDSIGCEPFAESGAQLTKITIEDGDTPIRCHVRDAWPMGCYPVFGRYVNVEEIYIGRNYSSFVSRGWVEAVYDGSWSLIKDSEHLKKVTLGNVFTEVPYAMFYGCKQLQEVNISPNAKSVGKEAFSHCESLTDIDLPDGIETIDEEAFYYCTALERIGLPQTLRVIGGNAFTYCNAFSSFTIPASVDSIGANILADCDNLRRIDIAYSPEPLKYYCPTQFQNSLRSAPIDTLYTDRYIDGALSDNRTLKKLYIGPNVTALHDYNFSDCYNIDEVFSLNPEPPTCEGSSVFYSGIKQNGTLHVPAGSLEAYKEAYIWQDFFNIVDDIESDEPVEPTVTQAKLSVTRLADMSTARMSHQIMPVDDGFVVFGGHTTSFSRTQTAERYDIATDSWTLMNMLYHQDYAAGIVTTDGKMLLAGGMSGNSGTGASNQCELYDPADDTFTATGSMAQARSMATATMTQSGKIYVNGCWYNSSYGLECYDPESGTFSKVAEGLNANHPLLLSLRGERVAIAYGSTMVVAEDGETTNVESDLLTDYPILKGWDEMQMHYYQVADYSHIVVGKSGSQAVLLNVYDDATEGVKVAKIADLPITLPDDENIGIGYHDEVTRVFCDNDRQKVYVQTTLADDGFSPVIVEYQYPSASKLAGGSIVVYATDTPLEKHVDNAAWTMLSNGTLISAGGGDSNFAPHNVSYIYTLGEGSEYPDAINEMQKSHSIMQHDGAVYSIAGQRLSKPQRGINIVNGKKAVLK